VVVIPVVIVVGSVEEVLQSPCYIVVVVRRVGVARFAGRWLRVEAVDSYY